MSKVLKILSALLGASTFLSSGSVLGVGLGNSNTLNDNYKKARGG